MDDGSRRGSGDVVRVRPRGNGPGRGSGVHPAGCRGRGNAGLATWIRHHEAPIWWLIVVFFCGILGMEQARNSRAQAARTAYEAQEATRPPRAQGAVMMGYQVDLTRMHDDLARERWQRAVIAALERGNVQLHIAPPQ